MSGEFNTTFIPLITLALLFISSLCWLALRALKEGRKAINEKKIQNKYFKRN